VPKPIGADEKAGLALYSWVSGEAVSPGSVTGADVEAAAAFLAELAVFSQRPAASGLRPASEACFCWRDHLELLDNRLTSLGRALEASPGGDPLVREAVLFLEARLLPAWRRLRAEIVSAVPGPELDRPLEPEARLVSPSDFGFHNALRTEAGLVFVDFEYAGWDDPAKLICDFASQPRIPPPPGSQNKLAEALDDVLPGREARRLRIARLLPVHRLKWCCIILNEFKRGDAARRGFAGERLTASARAGQLKKAEAYFREHVPRKGEPGQICFP
jgi:hypothetical protein